MKAKQQRISMQGQRMRCGWRMTFLLIMLSMVGLMTRPLVGDSAAEERPTVPSEASQGSSGDVETRGLTLGGTLQIQGKPSGAATILPSQPNPAILSVGRCVGPDVFISPNATFPMTCQIATPLGGARYLILPEMWLPGNGCIVPTDIPHVFMVNGFGVAATMKNRCGSSFKGSEGGLAWIMVEIKP